MKNISKVTYNHRALLLLSLTYATGVHAVAGPMIVDGTTTNPSQVNQGVTVNATPLNNPLTINSGGFITDAGPGIAATHSNPVQVAGLPAFVNETIAITVNSTTANLGIGLQSGANSAVTITGNLSAAFSTTLNMGISAGGYVSSNSAQGAIQGTSLANAGAKDILNFSNKGTLENLGQGSAIATGDRSASWSITNHNTGLIKGGTNKSAVNFSVIKAGESVVSFDNQGTITANATQTGIQTGTTLINAFSNSGTITGKTAVDLSGSATDFTNSGTLKGTDNTVDAVVMGTGSMTIKGGSVVGKIKGGGVVASNLNFDLGTNGTFTTDGDIYNFNTVNVNVGTLVLKNNVTATAATAMTVASLAGLRISSPVTIKNNIVDIKDNATLTVDITATNSGKLSADGFVNLNSAKIVVNNTGTTLLPTGSSFTIVESALGINKVAPTFTLPTSVLYNYATDIGAKIATVSVTRARLDSLVGANTIAGVIAKSIEDNLSTITDVGLQTVLGEISKLPSAASIGSALAQLAPRADSASRSGVTLTLNKNISVIENRIQRPMSVALDDELDNLNHFQLGYNAGTHYDDYTARRPYDVWGQIYAGKSEQFLRQNIPGYDGRLLGALLGMDFPFNEAVRLGSAIGYGRYFTKSKTFPVNVNNIHSLSMSFYGTYDINCLYFDGLISIANNTYYSKRRMIIGALDLLARNEHHGRSVSFKLGVGKVLQDWVKGFDVQPFASVLYTTISEHAYTERGALGVNLAMARQNTAILEPRVGGKISYTYKTHMGRVSPNAHFSLGYDFLSKRPVYTPRFMPSSTAFTMLGPQMSPFDLSWGLGVNVRTPHDVVFLFNYDGTYKDDFLASSVQFKATYRF